MQVCILVMLIKGEITLSDNFYLLIQTCLGLQTWRFYSLLQGLLMPKQQMPGAFLEYYGWALFGIVTTLTT